MSDLTSLDASCFVALQDDAAQMRHTPFGVPILDLATPVADIADSNERADRMLKKWKQFLLELPSNPEDTSVCVILFPQIRDPRSVKILLGLIRNRIDPETSSAMQQSTLHAVMFGDALTWENSTTHQEGRSNLSRAVLDNLWILHRPEGMDDALHWLTGGDLRLQQLLLAHSRPTNNRLTPDELRLAVHKVVSALLDPNSPEHLDQRLRELRGLPPGGNDTGSDQSGEIGLDYGELFALLPGNHGAKDENAVIDWVTRRRHAQIPGKSFDYPRQRRMLLGGLLARHSDASSHWLRLRSPLLAYAVSQIGIARSRWTQGHSALRESLMQPFRENVDRDTDEDGLDKYLKGYLNKALYAPDDEDDFDDDYEDDQWTTAEPSPELVEAAGGLEALNNKPWWQWLHTGYDGQ